jgi:hypothetical protein
MTAHQMLAAGLAWTFLPLPLLILLGKAIDAADRRNDADMASWITAEREHLGGAE